MNNRLVVLTDIDPGLENDDIESLVWLLLYSNEIHLEGIIAVTSSWYKKGANARDVQLTVRVINAYAAVKSNLDVRAPSFPHADYLHSITHAGIPAYGAQYGDGFGEPRFDGIAGVHAILAALERPDDPPRWVSLWGRANTLAQAVDVAERTSSAEQLERLLARLRIVATSDQDAAGHRLRERFGDRLFYVVSPLACHRQQILPGRQVATPCRRSAFERQRRRPVRRSFHRRRTPPGHQEVVEETHPEPRQLRQGVLPTDLRELRFAPPRAADVTNGDCATAGKSSPPCSSR